MFSYKPVFVFIIIFCSDVSAQKTGPYYDLGVSGFINSNWRPANPLEDIDCRINPIFRGWAGGFINYLPAEGVWPQWADPRQALGPVTGDLYHIVSLGDLDQDQIKQGLPPGRITLTFAEPHNIIRDGQGYDFVIFENGFVTEEPDTLWPGFTRGLIVAELAYVEVSSDGQHFARFDAVSLTDQPIINYGPVQAGAIHNLAGKHPNANGVCFGTPFDLHDLADDPLVKTDLVDLQNIRYVRLVDIPGSGDYLDQAVNFPDPNTYPNWQNYRRNHPIYDLWPTWGSSGFDLEAIGVLHEQQYQADINLDGIVDLCDVQLFTLSWLSHFGQENYNLRCDLADPPDGIIDGRDWAVFAQQWLKQETWRK